MIFPSTSGKLRVGARKPGLGANIWAEIRSFGLTRLIQIQTSPEASMIADNNDHDRFWRIENYVVKLPVGIITQENYCP